MTNNEQVVNTMVSMIKDCYENCQRFYGYLEEEEDDTGKDFLVDQMFGAISKANDRACECEVAFK